MKAKQNKNTTKGDTMNKKGRYIILAKNGNRITIKAPRYMKSFIKAFFQE